MSASRRTLAPTDGQRLGHIRTKVNAWRDYVGQSHPALPGSSLAADDAAFPVLPPSHLIWQGILVAVDHLDMFMGALDGGKSHPLAPSTLARSGILGGAHALWLLDGPDRAERQRRGLRLAHEEFRRETQLLRELADVERDDPATEPATDVSTIEKAIDLRTEWIDRAIATGGTLGMRPGQVTAQLDETSVIDIVTKRYVELNPESKELAKTYRILWRMYSGTAHALRWSSLLRAKIVPNEGGGGSGLLTNDLSDLGMAAGAVYLFVERAINLYEIRRQPHIQ